MIQNLSCHSKVGVDIPPKSRSVTDKAPTLRSFPGTHLSESPEAHSAWSLPRFPVPPPPLPKAPHK